MLMPLICGDTNREKDVCDAHPCRCGLIDIVTCGRGPSRCWRSDSDMSIVAANANGPIKSIDIESASLRQRPYQRCRPVSESAIRRLLCKSKTLRKIPIFQINRMIVKETHPLPVVDRHSYKSVTDRIELESI